MDTLKERLGLSNPINEEIEIDEYGQSVSQVVFRTFDRLFNDDAKYVYINPDWSVVGIQENEKPHIISYQLIGIISVKDLSDIVYSRSYDIDNFKHLKNSKTDFKWDFYKRVIISKVKDETDVPENYIVPESVCRGSNKDNASLLVYIPLDLRSQEHIERIEYSGSRTEQDNLRVSINHRILEVFPRPRQYKA